MRNQTLKHITAHDFAGMQLDQFQKLRNGSMTIDHLKWFNNLSFEERERLMKNLPDVLKHTYSETENFTLLSKDVEIIIDPCDGAQTLKYATEIFSRGINSTVTTRWEAVNVKETKEARVEVYGMVNEGLTFATIFELVGRPFGSLCLTQHQIKEFCAKHPNWLATEGNDTFFLFEERGPFFTAGVHMDTRQYAAGALALDVYPITHCKQVANSHQRRLVVNI
jgi:hypothetical protein